MALLEAYFRSADNLLLRLNNLPWLPMGHDVKPAQISWSDWPSRPSSLGNLSSSSLAAHSTHSKPLSCPNELLLPPPHLFILWVLTKAVVKGQKNDNKVLVCLRDSIQMQRQQTRCKNQQSRCKKPLSRVQLAFNMLLAV